MNARRGAQGINSMTASDDGVGVPRVLVSRFALEAAGRSDAVTRSNLAGRAGGYSHVFAFAGGDTFAVETTGSKVTVIPGPGPHTNHYLDPELAALAPEPSEGSLSRFERLTRVLAEEPPDSPEDVMRILRDHDAAPQAVCLHPDEAEDDEASAVVFSMVADVEHGRMWVAAGNPCETEYEEVDLTGVV
jgi:isopenicillin-N N-acyltransferase-like protein